MSQCYIIPAVKELILRDCYLISGFHLPLLTGAGLFSLIVEDGLGEEIFALVRRRFDQIKRQSSLPSPSDSNSSSRNNSSSSQGNDSDSDYDINMPDLPPRNYKTDTLRSLFSRKKSSGSSESRPTSSGSEGKTGSLKKSPKSPTPKRIHPRTYYEEINIQCDELFAAASTRRSPPTSPSKQSHYGQTKSKKSPPSPTKISSHYSRTQASTSTKTPSHYSHTQTQKSQSSPAMEPIYSQHGQSPRSPPTTTKQPHHQQATKSPSYLNSLIRKHKTPLTQSMSNSSDSSFDSLYHVLCEYGSKPHRCVGGCRHPAQNYSQNYSHIRYPQASRR